MFQLEIWGTAGNLVPEMPVAIPQVSSGDTVEQLREKAAKMSGLQVEEIHLLHKGKILKDSFFLEGGQFYTITHTYIYIYIYLGGMIVMPYIGRRQGCCLRGGWGKIVPHGPRLLVVL